jgi:hypothetical protein
MPPEFESGTPPAPRVPGDDDRVLAAASRYRDELDRRPELSAELRASDLYSCLRTGQAWAFREWTERAVQAGVLTDHEAGTVDAALERADWDPGADLAMRCAVVQLMAELLGEGVAS